jgi:hypothetical protein
VTHCRAADALGTGHPAVILRLADAYLGAHAYNESEREYRRALAAIDSAVANRHSHVGDLDTERMHVHQARGLALFGLAHSHAQRSADLEPTKSLLSAARRAFARLKDESARDAGLAACDMCQGMVQLKLGHAEKAIVSLQQSLVRRAEADTYTYLAEASWVAAQSISDKERVGSLAAAAREALEHAQGLDHDGRNRERIARLRKLLDGRESRATSPARTNGRAARANGRAKVAA